MPDFYDHEQVSISDKTRRTFLIDSVHRSILLLSAKETLLVLKQCLSQGSMTACVCVCVWCDLLKETEWFPPSPLTSVLLRTRCHHDSETSCDDFQPDLKGLEIIAPQHLVRFSCLDLVFRLKYVHRISAGISVGTFFCLITCFHLPWKVASGIVTYCHRVKVIKNSGTNWHRFLYCWGKNWARLKYGANSWVCPAPAT